MAFVDVALAVGSAVGLEGTAAVVGGGALLGGGAGALYGGLTGKNMLNSALTGAALGGLGAYGAGSLGAGGAGVQSAMAGPFWGNTPALATAASPTVNAAGLADAAGTIGTAQGVSPAVGQMVSNAGAAGTAAEAAGTTAGTAAKTALTGKQMLGYGLAGTTALSLLGGMKPRGLANQSNPGEIRPYEYHTAQRTGADGNPVYFQPVQYNLDGSTVSPMDTSERRYFDQSYTALPTYKAATGGVIAFAGKDGSLVEDDDIYDLSKQLTKLKALNVQLEPKIEELANQKLQYSGETSGLPDRAVMQKLAMSQPDSLRGIGQAPMGMVQGSQMMDRMNAMYGGQPSDVAVTPYSFDPKNLAGAATINKQLDDDTRLKLMAAGHKGQMGSGIDRIGAGISRNLSPTSDISAFYEKTPGFNDKMMGVKYNQRFAGGGLADLAVGGRLQNQPVNVNFMGDDMYPQSQIQHSYYATPSQMPTSAQQTMASYEPETNPLTGQPMARMAGGGTATATAGESSGSRYTFDPASQRYTQIAAPVQPVQQSDNGLIGKLIAQGALDVQGGLPRYSYDPQLQAYKALAGGGQLGGYSDGGRMLKGPGDGMSDSIPASIGGKQPARLADGEFVVPADVVSHLGNGSTDAGAKRLYDMMDRVRKARTGNKKQGKQIKPEKYLPK